MLIVTNIIYCRDGQLIWLAGHFETPHLAYKQTDLFWDTCKYQKITKIAKTRSLRLLRHLSIEQLFLVILVILVILAILVILWYLQLSFILRF